MILALSIVSKLPPHYSYYNGALESRDKTLAKAMRPALLANLATVSSMVRMVGVRRSEPMLGLDLRT